MINRDEAERISNQFIQNIAPSDAHNIQVIQKLIREEDFGWVFAWNDRRYVEDGDIFYALDGNEPIVVSRRTGIAQFLPRLPMPVLDDQKSRLQWFLDNQNVNARIDWFASTIGASEVMKMKKESEEQPSSKNNF
jgi:hypothetical protein